MRYASWAGIAPAIMFAFLVKAPMLGQQPKLNDSTAGSPNGDQLQHGYPTGEELFAKLIEHNLRREANLKSYSVSRHYCVRDRNDKVRAELEGIMEYHAPGFKQFKVSSEHGSLIVRKLVFHGIMESEMDASMGKSHRDSSITPANYILDVVGEEIVDGHLCLVANATPRRKDKYLFEGKVWVDRIDFAIVKIEGRPARNPSFWVKKVEIVRRYQKIGDFWLPLRDETVSQVRIVGKGTLTIDHQDYRVLPSDESEVRNNERNTEPVLPAAMLGGGGPQGNAAHAPVNP
jgi:hypothetical protein